MAEIPFGSFKERMKQIEIHLIRQALDAARGNITRAAELLGIRRTTLSEKIKKFDLRHLVRDSGKPDNLSDFSDETVSQSD